MELAFVKMHGLGNDFVFIEDLDDELDLSAEQVERLCNRHFGIGADGVIVVKPADDPACDARMHYINADGTLAQMCGNGVRCFAKYLVDRRIVNPAAHSLCAQTLAGPREIRFETDEAGCMTSATVDMGAPIIDPGLVPTRLEANARTDGGEPFAREAPSTPPGASSASRAFPWETPTRCASLMTSRQCRAICFQIPRTNGSQRLTLRAWERSSNRMRSGRKRRTSSLPSRPRMGSASTCACSSVGAARRLHAARGRAQPPSRARSQAALLAKWMWRCWGERCISAGRIVVMCS